MAFGDSPEDKALDDAWNSFCDKLKAAGHKVFKDYNPANDLQRADGYRFLTQNLSQVFDLALETKDTKYPMMHNFCSPTRKLGGDNADFTYTQVWIDGNSTYRITGTRGTARFVNFVVHGPRSTKAYGGNATRPLHDPFGDVPEANIFGHQLECDWHGNYELYVGGPKRGPNWLPTTPGSRKMFIRQGFDSWDEVPATMQIERIDMTDPRPMPTSKTMIEAFDWAGTFVTALMNDWPDWPFEQGGVPFNKPNQFPPLENVETDKNRGRAINNMYWELAPDEALIYEFKNYDGFWAFTNMGQFMNSMDYLYRPVSYSPARSTVDADGMVRFVMTHEDPGYHNWMDTQSFTRGNMTFRNLFNNSMINIHSKVVKRDKIAAAMHPSSAKCTKEERTAQMWKRFNAIRRRYGIL